MTQLLAKAFDEVSQLPEEEQDSFAQWVLLELRSEQKWAEAFAGSADQLATLAKEALARHAAGETKDLDPEAL